MCVSLCSRRGVVYFNHEDCPPGLCPIAAEAHAPCQTCRHQQGDLCGLTRAPLPEAGGCCHHNVTPLTETLVVTPEGVALLGARERESVAEVLEAYAVDYAVDEAGQVTLDPAGLSLPDTFGLGTEPLTPAEAWPTQLDEGWPAFEWGG